MLNVECLMLNAYAEVVESRGSCALLCFALPGSGSGFWFWCLVFFWLFGVVFFLRALVGGVGGGRGLNGLLEVIGSECNFFFSFCFKMC